MVPARSKSAAITRLRMEKAYDKRLLHVTPFSDILRRRAYWKKERAYWKKEAEAGMAQQALEAYARMRGHLSFARLASACGLAFADAQKAFVTQEVGSVHAQPC